MLLGGCVWLWSPALRCDRCDCECVDPAVCLQRDAAGGVHGREAAVYEPVLRGAVVLPDPRPEERLGGEPRQEPHAP